MPGGDDLDDDDGGCQHGLCNAELANAVEKDANLSKVIRLNGYSRQATPCKPLECKHVQNTTCGLPSNPFTSAGKCTNKTIGCCLQEDYNHTM